MALRAQHFGVTFIFAALVLGYLAYHTDNSKSVQAAVPASTVSPAAQSAPVLQAVLVPSTAQFTAGTNFSFSVDSIYTDKTGHISHVSPVTIAWKPTGATVASYSGVSVVLKAGSAAANGNLGVDITYAGLSAHADAPLKIVAAATPTPKATPAPTPAPSATPTPSPSPTPLATPAPLSDADTARLGALVSIFRPATPTNSAPLVSLPVLGCLEKNLGSRFSGISSGQTQPAAADRKAAGSCFTGADPVPAILAPVAPDQVAQLAVATTVTMSDVTKQSVAGADGKSTDAFHLSGTGAPNASIYLYIFSDPLVLRTQTNAGGAWEYILQASLPSGDHQVYAVAEKDAGNFVRTAAAAFSVPAPPTPQPAAATAAKQWWSVPLDWLSYIKTRITLKIAYEAGAGIMALLAIIIFVHAIRSRARARRLAQATALVMPVTAPPAAPEMPVQSEAAAAATVEAIVNAPVQLRGAPGGTVDPTYPQDPKS